MAAGIVSFMMVNYSHSIVATDFFCNRHFFYSYNSFARQKDTVFYFMKNIT